MARMPRAEEFLIEPARLTEDDDTVRLSLAEFGAYSRTFLRAWSQPEHPGVIPAVDSVLAAMAGLPPQDGHLWPAIRTAIEPLFDSGSRPGYWILHGLVETHERQTAYIEAQRAKGIASGKSRRRKRSNRGSRSVGTEPQPTPEPTGVRGTVLGVGVGETTNHPPTASQSAPTGGTRMVRPTLEEVTAYCRERAAAGRPPVDPEAWMAHYESNGWKVGMAKTPMQDWRAAVRTWERNNRHPRATPATNGKLTGAQIIAFGRQQEIKT